jgi:hypothetical protein
MAVLFRVFLIALIIYLVVRMIRQFMEGPSKQDTNVKSPGRERKVSRDVGEYVDFEEVDGEGRRAKGEEKGAGSRGSSRVSDKERGTRAFR